MRRLILFPGMGGDRRLCQHLHIGGVMLLTPNHRSPLPGASLTEFATALAEEHKIGPDDVVGGVSFGGMLAAEIARLRAVRGLVLLGSCLDPRRKLPKSYQWLEKAGPLLPDAALGLRTWGPILRSRFAPLTPEAEDMLRAMAAVYPVSQIRDFGRMLFSWDGARPACPTLSIHGDKDRIIPLAAAEPGVVLEKAGHAFTLTHAEQTSMHVTAFLAGLP
jgi:pimeloyl-ACP methyl ester carboxylesterase